MMVFWDNDVKGVSSYVYGINPTNPIYNPPMCFPKVPPLN